MPSKRKRNADGAPAAKRKIGAAPKRAAAPSGAGEAGAAAAATAAAPPAVPAAEPGKTQPLEAAAPTAAPADAALPTQGADGRPEARTAPLDDAPAGTSPAPSSPSPAGTASEPDAGPAEEPADTVEGETPEAPQADAAEAAASEEAARAEGKPDAAGKATKRKSTRSERRRDRKKAKADKRAQMSAGQRAFRVIRVLAIVLAALAIVAGAAAAAGISYHRWSAYDDALDIQGTWYVSGTDTPIEVTADTIVLSDDVAYRYKIDPSSKTIEFSFGNLKGQGHYRFSLDRQYLVIFDGEYTWEESLSTDVAWLVQAIKDHLLSNPNDLAQGAFYNVTLLSRSSADASALSASVVTTPEGPRVVWSAPDADTSSDGAAPAPDDAADESADGGGSAPSGSSDVDSLLGNLSDRPAG